MIRKDRKLLIPSAADGLKCLLLGTLLLSASLAVADEHSHYDRIQLSAQAVAEVNNDTLVALLSAQRKGNDLARLADEVNQVVARAIRLCKQSKAIEVQTLGYSTTAVYEKQQQTGWRVSQSLQLKSHDATAIGKLLGELQQTMLLQGMEYQVSSEQKNQVEDALIEKAIAAFQQRAKIITRQLGRKQYRLVNMQINTSGVDLSPMRIQRFQAMDAMRAAPAQIEAGKQQVTVTASGIIELELN